MYSTDGMGYFLGEVMHPYHAESDMELTLSVGDYIVIRKVIRWQRTKEKTQSSSTPEANHRIKMCQRSTRDGTTVASWSRIN